MGSEVDVWQAAVDYMSNGLFGGTAGMIIMAVFIIGICAYGLIKSRKIYREV
jgi:hypothetical protein